MSADEPDPGGQDDQRAQARVHVSTKIQVSGTQGIGEASLQDLSRGGARVLVDRRVGELGDTLELFFPDLTGTEEIGVVGEIVRLEEAADGFFELGVRFVVVEPRMEQALTELLESLLEGFGGGFRRHPRIARRIGVRYGSQENLLAMLENISHGGLSMHVSKPLVLDERIDVALLDGDGQEILLLPGRVVNHRTVTDGELPVYSVGLSFQELSQRQRGALDDLLLAMGGTVSSDEVEAFGEPDSVR